MSLHAVYFDSLVVHRSYQKCIATMVQLHVHVYCDLLSLTVLLFNELIKCNVATISIENK